MPTGKRWVADPVVLGLGALFVVQLAVAFGKSSPPSPASVQAAVPGVSVRGIQGIGRAGAEPLAVDGPTLLLAFHSECAHCLRVSPEWSAWLRAHDSGRVLAISREELGVAERYVDERGWSVVVRSVSVTDVGGLEAALLRRTPWIYVVDAEGVVRAAGHGNQIEELGALFEELVDGFDH